MSINADNTQSWLQQHQQLAELAGNKLPWLEQLRTEALQQFEKIGLPKVRDEDWRYTNLRALKSKAFELSENTYNDKKVDLTPVEHPRLVFVNGHFSQSNSDLTNLPTGVIFTSLKLLLETQAEKIEPYLGQALPKIRHGFTELNTAFFEDGYGLLVDKNTDCKQPLEVVYISDEPQTLQLSHTRNLVVAEEASNCTIIERYIGSNNEVYLNNGVSEIIAKDSAQIDHYKIQAESAEAFHIGAIFSKLQDNSKVTSHNIAHGSLMARNDINMQLLGEGSYAEMNGLVLASQRQHVDNHTEVNHAVANCHSDQYYKSILDDRSRSVFRARIIVAEDAQQTAADQQNKSLLMSGGAKTYSKPQLEIYADDVKCSHGATVGQLDPKSIFYLRSRGIDLKTAQALLTVAFANEVIERLKVDSVKQELIKTVAGELSSDSELFDQGSLLTAEGSL